MTSNRTSLFGRKLSYFWIWLSVCVLYVCMYSTGGIKIGLTLKIEFSTHRKVMDKPLWGWTKLVTKFKFSFKKWLFVTPSVAFYVNFPKKSWFWWSRQGRDGYSEFDVFKRSRVMNRCTGMPRTWSGVLWIDFEVKIDLNIVLLGYILNQGPSYVWSSRCFKHDEKW